MLGSGEPRPQLLRAGEIDRTDQVVGEDAERRFAPDLLETSGLELPTGSHSLDRAERMFGRAPALSNEAWIREQTSIHPLQRILVKMPANQTALRRRAAGLKRESRRITFRRIRKQICSADKRLAKK